MQAASLTGDPAAFTPVGKIAVYKPPTAKQSARPLIGALAIFVDGAGVEAALGAAWVEVVELKSEPEVMGV